MIVVGDVHGNISALKDFIDFYLDTCPQEKLIFLVELSVEVALNAHHSQRRKSSTDPYIIHPLRVAYLAKDAGLDLSAVCAAILHDVVEDTEYTIHSIDGIFKMNMISPKINQRVCDLVQLLTKWWPDETPQDRKRVLMAKYYDKILQDQDAICIKLLDRIDNLRDMANDFPNKLKWAKKYLSKTNQEFGQLVLRCENESIKVLFNETVKNLANKIERYEAK